MEEVDLYDDDDEFREFSDDMNLRTGEIKDTAAVATLRRVLFGFGGVFDGFIMIAVAIAFVTSIGNEENYLLFFNVPHILFWLFVIIVSQIRNRVYWFEVLGGVAIVIFLLDTASFIWRIINLVDCYGSSSGNSCRDFLVNAWIILVGNGLWLITDLVIAAVSLTLKAKEGENVKDATESLTETEEKLECLQRTSHGKASSSRKRHVF